MGQIKILDCVSKRFSNRSEHLVTFLRNGVIKTELFAQYDTDNTPLKQIIFEAD